MNISSLLFNRSWDGILKTIPHTISAGDIGYAESVFVTNNHASVKLCKNLHEALRIYAGKHPTRKLTAVTKTADNTYALEIHNVNTKETTIVLQRKNKAGEIVFDVGVVDEFENINNYILADKTKNKAGRKGTDILVSLIPYFLEEEEFKRIYNDKAFQTFLSFNEDAGEWKIGTNMEDFIKSMCVLSGNVYPRLTHPDDYGKNGVKAVLEGEKGVSYIDKKKLNAFKVKSVISGMPKFITIPTSTSLSDFAGKYTLSKRTLTADEKKRVPILDPWYVIPEALVESLELFQKTSQFPAPFRTIYLVGGAGSGKTNWAKATATGLNLPYDHMTCNTDTDIFAFMGTIFPTSGGNSVSFDDVRKSLGLPNTDDIINDPETAYEQIMGKKPVKATDADPSVLMTKMISLVMDKSKELYGNAKDFTYVEGGFITAVRNGYVFEVQEIGSVKKAGVAVGLNALLESGDNAFITLPTGETIKKHPDCVIVFTSNREYEGCANLNQSVLSRMALVKRIETPDKEVLIQRITKRLNFPLKYKDKLEVMVDTVKNIEVYCKEHDISDGVCGFRELENWAMACLCKSELVGEELTDDIVGKCGIDTVLNKVSQTDEYIEEVRTACYDVQYGN